MLKRKNNKFHKLNIKFKGFVEKSSFNLIEVIILMIITAICSLVVSTKVAYIKNGISKKTMLNADLHELTETYETLVNDFYKDVNKDELINAGIKGMIDYLGDPYSVYFDEETTETFNENLEGEYVGMGGEITLKEDNKVYITKIFKDSPAEKAGLKINDILVKIDNKSIINMDLAKISELIKGKSGTKVNVTISRGNKEIEYSITRMKVDIPSVSSKIIEKNDKKIGVITITTFAANTYKQFLKVEGDLESKKVDSLIIDLRNNSGGYLTTVKSISELFLDKNQIIYQLGMKNSVQKIKAGNNKKITLKTGVLVNGASASASEILTAALKENLNSPVIGTKTYGKGKVQKTQSLSSGAMIKYTIESWLTPNGAEIDGIGIEPTNVIDLSKNYYDSPSDRTDNQLQKALEIMSK